MTYQLQIKMMSYYDCQFMFNCIYQQGWHSVRNSIDNAFFQ